MTDEQYDAMIDEIQEKIVNDAKKIYARKGLDR